MPGPNTLVMRYRRIGVADFQFFGHGVRSVAGVRRSKAPRSPPTGTRWRRAASGCCGN